MTNGYGKNVTADHFPVVKRFLEESLTFPHGAYSFADLVRLKFAKKSEKRIATQLYGFGKYGISAGDIDPYDAKYIHGTVSLALMAGTRFNYAQNVRQVIAEIGAGDDNWDFESSTIGSSLNMVVGTVFGPDHYNLTKPIKIQFRGVGK